LAERSSGVADEAPGHADALDAAAVDIDDVFGAGMNDDVLVRAHAFEAIDGRCDHVRRVGKEAHGASRRAGGSGKVLADSANRHDVPPVAERA